MRCYLERLYHYCCDACDRWWSVADLEPPIGSTTTCPHCGHVNTVEGIEQSPVSAATPERSPHN